MDHPGRLLLLARHAALRLQRLFVSLRGTRCRRLAVLVMYVCMNLGLPVGLGSAAPKAAPVAAGCRCPAEARAEGRCCCRKPTAPVRRSGCCGTQQVAATKACCSKKTSKQEPEPLSTEPETTLAWSSGCPCGPVDTPLVLICPQHRILADANAIELQFDRGESLTSPSCLPCGTRPRPSVPPPESSLV